jgi:hypothetical protein
MGDLDSVSHARASGVEAPLRAALVVPLFYIISRFAFSLSRVLGEDGQSLTYYLVGGLLQGLPIVVWGTALVLLIAGLDMRPAWAFVSLGGLAVCIYGLVSALSLGVETESAWGFVLVRFDATLVFGLYVTLIAVWRLKQRRAARRLGR